MKHLLANLKNQISAAALCGVVSSVLLTACSSTGSRIQTGFVPAGSLQLAQVMEVPTRKQIIEAKWLLDDLIQSGVKETEVRDGIIVFARIYCCGGPNERQTAPIVYVPTGINAEPGDIIEMKVGHPSRNGDPGELNTTTQIRQKASETGGSCRWDPH